ncbi:hypothetical protein FA15DRAFT_662524 [Coprinopsis marcescibilis]|uniref:Ribosome biogenesis protein SLX9 n=1 Tax=Coprinopsis marcescibilis TaxID=230819 RepID=A0A5C3LCR3_COPMA|nr:hypothetical protein FA15DRAFT_662524 [Coprinopsis marcescibilis]
MPKDRRTRGQVHHSSVKLAKRQFAVQDNAVQHIELGSGLDATVEAIPQASTPTEDVHTMTKKEKSASKKEAFLNKLELSRTTHSKSHEKRMKKKAKEQLASGLSDIQMALDALAEAEGPSEVLDSTGKEMNTNTNSKAATSKSLKIGEGKAATLRDSQRKRLLQLERLRQPLILTNPTFSTNPFSTVRLHAQNSLVKREAPTS